jgi:hypothetical protein
MSPFLRRVEERLFSEREERVTRLSGAELRSTKEVETSQLRVSTTRGAMRRSQIKAERAARIAMLRRLGLGTMEIARQLDLSERQVRCAEGTRNQTKETP